jgi:hypothetical protein
LDWNTLDSSLTSALLHLMHLPTVNHIDLSFINNFPLSSLTSFVNLHRLDISHLINFKKDGSPEIVVQSETIPQIHEFHTSDSSKVTKMLLHAKRQDGRPAFNFMDLRRLSMSFTSSMSRLQDEENIRYILQNAKLIENLHLLVEPGNAFKIVGLHVLLSPIASTLKVLDLSVPFYDYNGSAILPLGGLCEELEAMAGHNVLEALSVHVEVDGPEEEDLIGSIFRKVEKTLVESGWSALRRVSFKVSIIFCMVSRDDISWEDSVKLFEALQSLPDKYLSHLPKLESVAFNFSAHLLKCCVR